MNRTIPLFITSLFIVVTLSGNAARAADKDPQSGMDWYARGRTLQDQKQYDEALAAYRHAIDLKFQPAGAWMRMAQIDAAQGRRDRAIEDLQKALAIAPVAVSLLPQIGGIPELEGDGRLEKMMAEADRARHPCLDSKESRQFDFWLGDWTVTNPQDQVVGSNTISKDLEGCVVRESWTDLYGNHGTSVNFYDPASRQWHQVWTSDNGTITHYQGSFRDGAMHFSAQGFGDADGSSHHRRMTFTPNSDGNVRQLIEDSEDGKDWSVSFDGTYRAAK